MVRIQSSLTKAWSNTDYDLAEAVVGYIYLPSSEAMLVSKEDESHIVYIYQKWYFKLTEQPTLIKQILVDDLNKKILKVLFVAGNLVFLFNLSVNRQNDTQGEGFKV